MTSRQRSILAAVTLFFVAPLVAEFLLGDFPVTWLLLLIVLAPMYGGGALLIRELARRSGRGWPSMFLLAAAYALIEEGFTTQSLFNPNYLGMHFLRFAWIPSLGIGAWWTILMLNVHVFWSMGVSIVLVEGLFPTRAKTPWLGKAGDGVVGALFVAGGVTNTVITLRMNHFVASRAQFTVTAVFCILLIAAAFLLPAPASTAAEGEVPGPWITGSATFVIAAADLLTPPMFGWGAVALLLGLDLVFLVFLWAFSRCSAWTALHTLSVGAAGALAYGLHAFIQPAVVHAPQWVVRGSNAVFFILAIAVVVTGVRRTNAALAADSVTQPASA